MHTTRCGGCHAHGALNCVIRSVLVGFHNLCPNSSRGVDCCPSTTKGVCYLPPNTVCGQACHLRIARTRIVGTIEVSKTQAAPNVGSKFLRTLLFRRWARGLLSKRALYKRRRNLFLRFTNCPTLFGG